MSASTPSYMPKPALLRLLALVISSTSCTLSTSRWHIHVLTYTCEKIQVTCATPVASCACRQSTQGRRHLDLQVDTLCRPYHRTTHFGKHTVTRCNTLKHTAAHCNTLQHTATHCNTLQHTATHCNTLQHIATHCNALQHTATL